METIKVWLGFGFILGLTIAADAKQRRNNVLPDSNKGVTQGRDVEDGRGKLMRRLLRDYDRAAGPLVIPPVSGPDPFTVQLGSSLLRAELSDDNVLTANIFLQFAWPDTRLSWESSDYGGIDKLRIPSKLIWKPDIELYNQIDPMDEADHLPAVVSSTGDVVWIPPTKVKVDCFPDTDETLSCKLKFGSWTYDGLMMDLQAYGGIINMNLDSYTAREGLTVIRATGERHVQKYACCPEPYLDITYTIVLKRS